jgi:hypothetical protein
MPAVVVQVKVHDLHVDIVVLLLTICGQYLPNLGTLHPVTFVALLLPTLCSLDHVAQAFKGFINGMTPATFLAWTIDGMVPSETFGGLTNTMGTYGLIRHSFRSSRAFTWGAIIRFMATCSK